jgi:mRNA interferase HigB
MMPPFTTLFPNLKWLQGRTRAGLRRAVGQRQLSGETDFLLDTRFPKWEHFPCVGATALRLYMRVISRRPLNELAGRYPEAKVELDAWFHEAEAAPWANPAQVKGKYGNASILKGSRVVFNICGNKYRLVVKINYAYSIVYVRFAGTHAEYDHVNAEEI